MRFAVSDAASFMKVLKNMGSVYSDDAYLLYQPNRENLIAVLNNVYSKIVKVKRDYEKIEFVFYYSGHSDEDGLLLSSDSVSYLELKKTIEAIPADVRIAILDSCYSGSFTQMKGGKKRPPFMLDTAYNMKGNAFMTSSSRDEVSQESERIKGSFFTHYLVLGLRGAADVTQDKKITLNEAYQYAYRETLVRTEKTLGGAQHPNYHIQMTGTGDVVLTDISKGSARLQFDENVEGRISIFTKDNILIAEFPKAYGQAVSLSLDPGEYHVSYSDSKGLNETKVTLKEETKNLALNDFSKTERELTAMRGGVAIFPEDNS
ncbi:MAG TPA: caspase family protein, partial [Spirochaetota bacterium]|nr:caspase family protein [Spirochaetota bacterium]